MSNLTFDSCLSYAPSMSSSSSSLILIFLYPSHLKKCPRGLKNPHQTFPFPLFLIFRATLASKFPILTILGQM